LIVFCAAVTMDTNDTSVWRDLFCILNMLSAIFSGYLVARNTWVHFDTYYKSQWSYLEILYFVLNFLISIGLITSNLNWFEKEQELVSRRDFRVLASINSIVVFT
jgi:hypothetical protein